MYVVLFVFRAIEIDNSFDGGDVEPSTCHVGGNQNVELTLLEFGKDLCPVKLGLISMDRRNTFGAIQNLEVLMKRLYSRNLVGKD